MAKNASIFGFPDNPSTGTVVETFLLPLVYILIALLAMGGDMAIRYCVSRQELFQSPDRKRKIRNLEENDEASPGIVEVAENSLRFFQFKRSREKFNRVRKETFPPKSSKKLRTPYGAGRKVLYCKCRGTGLIRALRMAIFLTCFAGLWSWVVILLQNISSKEDSNLNHHVTQFLAHSKALGKLTESIHTYGTCELVYKIMRSKMRQIGVWKRVGLTLSILAVEKTEGNATTYMHTLLYMYHAVSVLFAYFAVRSLALWTKVILFIQTFEN